MTDIDRDLFLLLTIFGAVCGLLVAVTWLEIWMRRPPTGRPTPPPAAPGSPAYLAEPQASSDGDEDVERHVNNERGKNLPQDDGHDRGQPPETHPTRPA